MRSLLLLEIALRSDKQEVVATRLPGATSAAEGPDELGKTKLRTFRNFVPISADSVLCVNVSWTGTKQCS